MSEMITINTGAGINFSEETIEPLPLYDDRHPMLSIPIPEYKNSLPNPVMTKLVKRMKMTMKKFGGIGLSANQCGVFERVFIIGTDQFQIACINPKVANISEESVKDNEGCLSYPGLYLKIDRPKFVDVEFFDENGTEKKMRLEGVTARCFLHELDHMNGVRITDHVGPVALQMAKKKQDKIIKKTQRKNKK
jgi:peptide deformylase